MTTTIPGLSEETLSAFVDRIREDRDLKFSVIQGVQARGFISVLDEHFTLSDEQRRRLEEATFSPSVQAAWSQFFMLALITDGDITMRQTGVENVTLQANSRSWSVDVHVECE
jgi:hypothetical protein